MRPGLRLAWSVLVAVLAPGHLRGETAFAEAALRAEVAGKPLLVVWTKPRCIACDLIQQLLRRSHRVRAELDRYVVVQLDPDTRDLDTWHHEMQLSRAPALIVFSQGEEKVRLVGSHDEEDLAAFLKSMPQPGSPYPSSEDDWRSVLSQRHVTEDRSELESLWSRVPRPLRSHRLRLLLRRVEADRSLRPEDSDALWELLRWDPEADNPQQMTPIWALAVPPVLETLHADQAKQAKELLRTSLRQVLRHPGRISFEVLLAYQGLQAVDPSFRAPEAEPQLRGYVERRAPRELSSEEWNLNVLRTIHLADQLGLEALGDSLSQFALSAGAHPSPEFELRAIKRMGRGNEELAQERFRRLVWTLRSAYLKYAYASEWLHHAIAQDFAPDRVLTAASKVLARASTLVLRASFDHELPMWKKLSGDFALWLDRHPLLYEWYGFRHLLMKKHRLSSEVLRVFGEPDWGGAVSSQHEPIFTAVAEPSVSGLTVPIRLRVAPDWVVFSPDQAQSFGKPLVVFVRGGLPGSDRRRVDFTFTPLKAWHQLGQQVMGFSGEATLFLEPSVLAQPAGVVEIEWSACQDRCQQGLWRVPFRLTRDGLQFANLYTELGAETGNSSGRDLQQRWSAAARALVGGALVSLIPGLLPIGLVLLRRARGAVPGWTRGWMLGHGLGALILLATGWLLSLAIPGAVAAGSVGAERVGYAALAGVYGMGALSFWGHLAPRWRSLWLPSLRGMLTGKRLDLRAVLNHTLWVGCGAVAPLVLLRSGATRSHTATFGWGHPDIVLAQCVGSGVPLAVLAWAVRRQRRPAPWAHRFYPGARLLAGMVQWALALACTARVCSSLPLSSGVVTALGALGSALVATARRSPRLLTRVARATAIASATMAVALLWWHHGDVPSRLARNEWEPWSVERWAELKRSGRPYLVRGSAPWCISCAYNDVHLFRSQAFANLVEENHIALLEGDVQGEDPAFQLFLQDMRVRGVPAYFLGQGYRSMQALPVLATLADIEEGLMYFLSEHQP